jgi:hypothetical protein
VLSHQRKFRNRRSTVIRSTRRPSHRAGLKKRAEEAVVTTIDPVASVLADISEEKLTTFRNMEFSMQLSQALLLDAPFTAFWGMVCDGPARES